MTTETNTKNDPLADGDLMDAYFKLMKPSSESPLIYHRWSLISSVAALLGRQAWINFGIERIYPNMFVCIIGNAGSRKSSAIKGGRQIMDSTGYNKFARERSSKEKFLKDLGDGFDKVNGGGDEDFDPDSLMLKDGGIVNKSSGPSEVYVSAGELEDFLGQGDAGFISLLTNLWDNLPSYGHGKMTSDDIHISEPTINMIGGCTSTTFNSVFPPEVIGSGMLSRMLLIYGGGPRARITFPPPLDQNLRKDIMEIMAAISLHVRGEMTVTEGALKIFDDVYQSNFTIPDGRFESYLNRRHVHYYKLCMVIAAMDLSMEITEAHAKKANSILHHAESLMPKALGQFGMAKNSDAANAVFNHVEAHYATHGEGCSSAAVFEAVGNNFESFSKDFTMCIQKLIQSSKVRTVKGRLVPASTTSKSVLPHVDFTNLAERDDGKQAQSEATAKAAIKLI